jgi:molybdopterin molybdotransferase
MISVEEAFKIVMSNVQVTGTETVPFMDSIGQILSEDVFSDIDMPPFNRSAVDGYACHRNDLDSELEVIEVIAAGKEAEKPVGINQCSKIMTGAMVPESCNYVFMVEDSEILSSGKVRYTGSGSKSNISEKGEDVKKGDIVLHKGKLIKPQDIAVLASVGYTLVNVRKKPRVGIISTGDELVEPSGVPGASRIRNSNAYQLLAQVKRAGGIGRYFGIAPDIEDSCFRMIINALEDSDLVLITGGVSMGDFDFVPSLLEKAGVKILFNRINVQPGKPTTFGVHPKALVFGLPGNPVSSFVQFETLVRPLICNMMGYDWKPVTYLLPMAEKFERKSVLKWHGFLYR